MEVLVGRFLWMDDPCAWDCRPWHCIRRWKKCKWWNQSRPIPKETSFGSDDHIFWNWWFLWTIEMVDSQVWVAAQPLCVDQAIRAPAITCGDFRGLQSTPWLVGALFDVTRWLCWTSVGPMGAYWTKEKNQTEVAPGSKSIAGCHLSLPQRFRHGLKK